MPYSKSRDFEACRNLLLKIDHISYMALNVGELIFAEVMFKFGAVFIYMKLQKLKGNSHNSNAH